MTALHPRLAQDAISLGRFPLSRLLLMNDAAYPWFILVPWRPGVEEIHALAATDQAQLMTEISLVSATAARLFQADKMNVAALGNLVPQLHVHIIVRYRADPAWPAPVWGKAPPVPYDESTLSDRQAPMIEALAGMMARE